jgi:hypothetical protein
MSGYICEPYRGHGIHIEIVETKAVSFNGVERRYKVAWHLYKEGHFMPANVIASFAETCDFACPEEAKSYAERRAHTFVDCAFTAKSR